MKEDIVNRSNIQLLVDAFYEKIKKDALTGYLFNDVAQVNWQHHLPRMYDFWENIIFQTGNFTGNPMAAHSRLHQLSPLKQEHFEQWLALFTSTVDELFQGANATVAKQKAASIALLMQQKISLT